jgi:hypothetical protein
MHGGLPCSRGLGLAVTDAHADALHAGGALLAIGAVPCLQQLAMWAGGWVGPLNPLRRCAMWDARADIFRAPAPACKRFCMRFIRLRSTRGGRTRLRLPRAHRGVGSRDASREGGRSEDLRCPELFEMPYLYIIRLYITRSRRHQPCMGRHPLRAWLAASRGCWGAPAGRSSLLCC